LSEAVVRNINSGVDWLEGDGEKQSVVVGSVTRDVSSEVDWSRSHSLVRSKFVLNQWEVFAGLDFTASKKWGSVVDEEGVSNWSDGETDILSSVSAGIG